MYAVGYLIVGLMFGTAGGLLLAAKAWYVPQLMAGKGVFGMRRTREEAEKQHGLISAFLICVALVWLFAALISASTGII